MEKGMGAMAMPAFIKARNDQEKNLKKIPTPDEHMQAARQHQYAAESSLQAKDHTSASAHLKKAAFHNEKAAQYYQKNSACYIDRAMKGK
jgi:hypothetical protein